MISKSATLGNQLEKLSPHAAEAATSSEAPHATLSGPSAAPLGVPSQTIPDRPRRRWWPWLLVLALAGAGLGISFGRPWLERIPRFWERSAAHPAKPPQRTVPIVAAPVRQADLDLYLNGLGTVTGFQTVTIRSRVDGELVRVAFTEGQMVQEGDLLAEIDPRAYQARLQQAEGQLAQDEAALKGAELTLQRYRQLVASNTVTGQQVDEQVALVRQAEGAVLADRGTIADAKLQVTYCRIEAPLSGRIGLRLVDAGNIVRANDPNGLAVITQIQPITMTFTIPQDDISRVQTRFRDGVTLAVEAYNRDFETKLATGKLLAIDNQVDVTTGTVRLKAIFENQDNMLFPNQFVNARLLVDVQRGAVLIPTAAVQHGPDSDFVYLVKSDDTVELRKVQVGPAEADQTAIQHGLAAGEMVVTEGVDKLQPGAKVVVQGRQPARGGASAESNSTKAAAADRKTPAADAPPADSAGGKASQ